MLLDADAIRSFYKSMTIRILAARKDLGRPLTLSEKILYSHLFSHQKNISFRRGSDYAEFMPDRVAMQDATAQMALLQFMMAEKEESSMPVSVHCDHLIMAKSGASVDLQAAKITNREVFDFLSSVCDKYNMDFWKPGSGIIHQVVLENYAFPGGMMIGTDSHTVNAGGLGMIAIGVGGADAVDVMSGMSWELKFPKLIGVRLTGKLSGWTSAKDIILKISGLLSVDGGTDSIIEYFGDGAESISCTGKGTICNMGAEVGATCSIFGYDEAMSRYLAATGRSEISEMADKVREHLTGDPEVYLNPVKYFDQLIDLNLTELEPYINGPFTPDLATPISMMKEVVKTKDWPLKIEVGLIGSCTNSSYEDLSRAASVARDAIDKKLVAKSEFTINPGSEQIREIAERDKLLDTFEKIGGKIFANACGPCIGQWDRESGNANPVNTIVHSFNRNFAKRNDGNPNTNAFVASPEVVTALAIAGNLTFNPLTDTLVNSLGEKVKLREPTGYDIPPDGFGSFSDVLQEHSENKAKVIVKINPESNRLQVLQPFPAWDGNDFTRMPLLIKVKGKCTTDHISMAGFWLKYRGHLNNISDNYMIGAVNFFNNQTNSIFNQLTGNYERVPVVARSYKASGVGSIVVGEENFGEGSSREHAAMEPRYLNVRTVLVKSFARIHETNLKKQGVLALTFADKNDYKRIQENDKLDVTGLKEFTPGRMLKIILHHADNEIETIFANHTYNEAQIRWFRAGSALNLIREAGQNKIQ